MRPSVPAPRVALTTLSLALLAACAADAPTPGDLGPPDRVTITVAALTYGDIDEAVYTLAVSAGGAEVWRREGITTTAYGDGAGAISYVGPCDATAGDNRVTVELTALRVDGEDLDPGSWRNPTPVWRDVPCAANADTPVRFDLTIMRAARQGFFDIAVNFEDIFCSAKLDCVDALLHNPDAEPPGRDATVVIGFACASGGGRPTHLWLDDVTVSCPSGEVFHVDPTGGPGNLGARPPLLFEAAAYRGAEHFPDVEKCYWNLALGISTRYLQAVELEHAAPCTVRGVGTATHSAGDDPTVPKGAIYPLIRWEVDIPLTGDGQRLACGAHPLDGEGSGVRTHYTVGDAVSLRHVMACADPDRPRTRGELPCAGVSLAGGGTVSFLPGPDGLVVRAGELATAPLALPPGLTLATCCADGCCDGPPPATATGPAFTEVSSGL